MPSLSRGKRAFPGRTMPEGGLWLQQELRHLTQLERPGHVSREGDLYAE